LVEGTCPDRRAVQPPDPGWFQSANAANETGSPSEPVVGADLAREMRRFLRIMGAPREGLTLVFPATDERGQPLLPSWFLEEVESRFSPDAWSRCTRIRRRLDPVPSEEFAGAPREARVRAVARVLRKDSRQARVELAELARNPSHRPSLEGTAAALLVTHR